MVGLKKTGAYVTPVNTLFPPIMGLLPKSSTLRPQTFFLPSIRESYKMWTYFGMTLEKLLDICSKTVVRIDASQPICYAAQLRIEGFTWE